MDCRTFRKNHLAFVDDTLPGVDVVRMQLHLSECPECERWDQRVRRSLLVARNHLGAIEPTEHFRARLDARLAQEKRSISAAPPLFGARGRMPVWPLAVGALALGVATVQLMQVGESPTGIARLQEAVIVAPGFMGRHLAAASSPTNATPAFIATVSSGMAILPALMLVDEASALPAAADEFTPASARAASFVPPER